MKGTYIFLVIILIIIIIVTAMIHKAKAGIRSFSNQVFGTNSLRQGLENQSRELAERPKSVSGMTKIFLPQIERDFPQFNYAEYKVMAETILKAALSAITMQDITLLNNPSGNLYEEISLRIADHKKRGIVEHFDNVVIHQTEVTAYTKRNGTCIVTLQMAVGYLHYTVSNGTVTSGSKELARQTKYNVELLYVQDAKMAGLEGAGAGVTCPNCGAPVRTLGDKLCEYCGSGIIEINLHTWSIHHFYEV